MHFFTHLSFLIDKPWNMSFEAKLLFTKYKVVDWKIDNSSSRQLGAAPLTNLNAYE